MNCCCFISSIFSEQGLKLNMNYNGSFRLYQLCTVCNVGILKEAGIPFFHALFSNIGLQQ